MSILAELKRRNVFRVAAAYLVVGWVLIEVATTVLPVFGVPDWVAQALIVLIALGFVPVLIFSWVYELTPEGIKREADIDSRHSVTPDTGRKLNYITIAAVVVGILFLVFFRGGQDIQDARVDDDLPRANSASIAVIPFINMSSNQEQEYFSDGLAEELLNLLAKIPELRVTSRTSAFSYKGKDIKIADIGRELNVDHVLEGSVRRSGNTVRITAQLINVDEDAHVWSETWDRTLDDVFVIQDEIASAVVRELRLRLLGDVPHSKSTSQEAYSLHLQAVHSLVQRTEESISRAERLALRALEIDPDYSPAWENLAYVYFESARIGPWSPNEAFPKAKSAIENVFRLDPHSAVAYAMLAELQLRYKNDVTQARANIEKALELSPDDADAMRLSVTLSFYEGDFQKGIQLSQRLAEVDPVFPQNWLFLGYSHLTAGNVDEALLAFRRLAELNPNSAGVHYYIAVVLLHGGDAEGALAELNKETLDGFIHTGQALAHHALGNARQSEDALQDLIGVWSESGAYQITTVYAYRDEVEKAFEWLDRAIESHDTGLTLMLGDAFLDNLRDDPRFGNYVYRAGLRPIQ